MLLPLLHRLSLLLVDESLPPQRVLVVFYEILRELHIWNGQVCRCAYSPVPTSGIYLGMCRRRQFKVAESRLHLAFTAGSWKFFTRSRYFQYTTNIRCTHMYGRDIRATLVGRQYT